MLAKAAEIENKPALQILTGSHVETWTYAGIAAAVAGLAGGFQAKGLQPGDRILLRLGNTPETPLAYLAAIWADFVPVPTSPMLTLGETEKIIAQLDPALILHDASVPCPPHANRIDLSALRNLMQSQPMDPTMGDPDRPAYIVYTSGTSGTPRAVEHAHRAIWARKMMHNDWYGLQPTDRLLHAGAFNWTYTMGTGLMDPWSVGATALIPAPGTDPGDLLSLLNQHKATLFAAAPGVYRKMCEVEAPPPLPNLRHGLSAGEKLGRATRDAWITITGTEVYEAFGMSECSTFISGAPNQEPAFPATGWPQTGRYVAITDSAGKPVARDSPGVIAIHKSDPGLMRGYLNSDNPSLPLTNDWFITGDEGVMDASGAVTYLGRADDMMNAGGFRVSPLEVEAAFGDLDTITGIAVTEVEVKTDVRVIAAFYTSPNPVDPDTLKTHAQSRLAAFKCPRVYVRAAELPTGPNGKLARKDLQQHWNAHHGQA